MSAAVRTATWHNWAGNQRTDPVRTVVAEGIDDVVAAVLQAARDGHRVKALGSGHSFTGIAIADDVAVRAPSDPALVRLDVPNGQVTVPAGMTLHTLNRLLWEHGLALPNLGDIEAQTVAGALSTGTHGTGAATRGLAAQVVALRMVLADGTEFACSPAQHPDVFSLARIGLGALGVLVEVTLTVVPAFRLHALERPEPLAEVLADLDERVEGNDHFEFYWFPRTDVAATKRHNRTDADGPARGRAAAFVTDDVLGNGVFELANRLGARLPGLVPRLNAVLADQMADADYVDRSYRVFCSPRRVRFLEMEYALPRTAIHDAMGALRAAADRHAQAVSFPVEVRFGAADDVPLSMAHGRDSVYLAVHVYRGQPYEAYFGAVEQALLALGGRPHWGKLHTRTADTLRPLYPGFDAFVALRDRLDPQRRFANAYLERVLG